MEKQEILGLIKKLNLSLQEDNLDTDVIREISNIEKKINGFEKPIFKENGVIVNENYDKFKFTGLNNMDYVLTNFYKIKKENNE